jgi:hypothetical protein
MSMSSVIPRQFPTQKMLPQLLLELSTDNFCSNADFICFHLSDYLFMTKWNQICNLHVNSAFFIFLLLIFGQSITDNLFSTAKFICFHHL